MEISLDTIKKSLSGVLNRFHVMIFVIFVLGGLIVVMLQLNSIIQNSSSSNTQISRPSGFDQKTIDDVNELRSADQAAKPLDLSGRTNPFVE